MSQPATTERGFFSDLFDTTFSRFVTRRVVKVLFILGVILLGLMVAGQVTAAFSLSTGFGVFALLIGAPIAFLAGVLYLRVLLEVLVVLFRIGDEVSRTRELIEQRGITSPREPVSSA